MSLGVFVSIDLSMPNHMKLSYFLIDSFFVICQGDWNTLNRSLCGPCACTREGIMLGKE